MTYSNYWRDYRVSNQRATLNDFGQLNSVWYLFPQGGGPRGAFETFSDLSPSLKNRDTIILGGVLREQVTAPLYIHDVTIIGAQNIARQATSGGVPTGGGATWMSPTAVNNALPLLRLNSQGWRLEDIYFNNAATGAPCVSLFRDAGSGVLESDASHASIVNCKFTGGDDGIQDSGGCNHVSIVGCEFANFAAAGAIAMSAVVGAGQGTLQNWQIIDNVYLNNVNHIIMGLTNANIYGNTFSWKGQTITTTLQISLTGGQHNSIWENKFGMLTTTAGMTTMFAVGTEDSWGPNHFANAVQYGSPLTTA